jgi:hypothetical protein
MANTYPTSQYPLGSTEVKVLYNNASNLDDAVNGTPVTWVDRFGVVRKSWAGIELDFENFLLASGYEFIGDYDDVGELTFTRPNQIMSKDGEYWRPGAALALPYTTVNNWVIDQPKFVSTGDASLRQALAASDGTTIIGFGDRTLFQKFTDEMVSVKDAPFNAVGDGVADDTAAIQALADYIAAQTQFGLTTSGALSAAYSGTSPIAHFPPGTYRTTAVVTWGSYLEIVGDSAIIKQDDPDADIFDIDLYQFKMSGMQFVGGRHQLRVHNANINSSMFEIDHCQFFLSSSYSVKTQATGGVWTHMSTNGTMSNCRWISCRRILDNCFDSMVINDPWMQPDSTNLDASAASINNRGATPTDPGAQTRLYINRGFGIPAVGTFGVDRPANIRWVDNWGSFISEDVRWGGEFGGMRIVDHLAVPDVSFPWNKTEVSVTGGLAFCGPSDDPNACIMGIQGQVPNSMTFGDYSGQVSSPLIRNLSSTDLTAYFATFQASTGKLASEYFKLDARNIITDLRAYTPLRPFMPDGLYPYLINGRNTRVIRTTQNLDNGGVDNIVSFSATPEYDMVAGAFVPANPTRLNMPNGCSKMRIEVDIVIDSSDATAKAISAQIETSAGNRWKGVTQSYGVNPYGDNIHFTTDVYGPPGTYWQLNIVHNAATDRNLVSCQVVMTPLDMII